MTYDVNSPDIPDNFEAPSPKTVEWPSHPIAQQVARGLPWLKMHMNAQTKPRKIIETMNLLKRLATEIYKVELAFIGQIMVYLLRRDTDWQSRVKSDLGGDKTMRKWWRRFERVQSGTAPKKRDLSEHQRNMTYDYARNVCANAGKGPTTDHDGLFRLALIIGGQKEAKATTYRPDRASKPTPVFKPIHITPTDLGFDNPARPDSGFRWNARCEVGFQSSNGPESKLQTWLEEQASLIQHAINILRQTGRRLDAHLFQNWLGHLHDELAPYLRLDGRATLQMGGLSYVQLE